MAILLDLKCEVCNVIYHNTVVSQGDKGTCCGVERVAVWFAPPALHIFQEQWVDHLEREPMFFRNKKDLKRALDARGLSMPLTHGGYS